MKLSVSTKRFSTKREAASWTNYVTEDVKTAKRIKDIVQFHNHSINIFNGPRKQQNCVGISGIMLDYDGEAYIPFDEMVEKFKDFKHIIYTTTSSTAEKPKIHVILPFEKILYETAEEQENFYLRCKKESFFSSSDTQVFERGRHFFPCLPPGRQNFQFHCNTTGKHYTLSSIKVELEPLKRNTADVDPETLVDFAGGSIELKDVTERIPSCYCPFHDDATPSAFVDIHPDNGRPYLYCSACDKTFFAENIKEGEEMDNEEALKIAQILGEGEVRAVKGGSLPIMPVEIFDAHPELRVVPEGDWLSPWFGVRGRCIMLYTREKLGKSTIVTADVIQAARNGNKVLWISAEEFAGEIANRVMKYSPAPPLNSFNIVAGWPTSVEQVEGLISRSGAEVVAIDSLTSLMANIGKVPKSSDTTAWQSFTLKFKKMAHRLNVAIILIHHANKNGEFIGSVGIGQGTDAIIPLHRIRKHIYKIGKKGNKVIDKIAEEAAELDGEDIYTNTTRVKYGQLRSDQNRGDVLLDYDPETGEINEQTHTFPAESVHFIAKLLSEGPKTKKEIFTAARKANMKFTQYAFYSAKNILKLDDIENGGKYKPSKECEDLIKNLNATDENYNY